MKKLCLVLTTVTCLALLASCASTISPDEVNSQSTAYEGNTANAGILGIKKSADGTFLGYIVTQWWMDHHIDRISKWGDQIQPPLTDATRGVSKTTGGTLLASKEAMDADLQCAAKELKPGTPTPGYAKLARKVGL